MRRFLALVVGAVALGAAGAGASAPAPPVTIRSCMQAAALFNAQITGNKLANYWLRLHSGKFAALPARKTIVAVWSFAPQAAAGIALYAWTAHGQRRIPGRSCRRATDAQEPPPARGLTAPFRVRDGWAIGRRFECLERGRLVVETRKLRDGDRMTVWLEPRREVIAVAEVRRGSGWLRASKRCFERDT